MGALHEGHLSLVDASRRETAFTAATIFVNPAQFAPHEDFSRYPRTLEADLAALAGRGADLVFAPPTEEVYRAGHATFVEMGGVAEALEGRCRPGHFRGVATVVLKLFHLVRPDVAFFGRKDYQQALVVRQMVADLDLPIEIRVCPIVRERDGLALSSRNVYLSADERRRALSLHESLRLAERLVAEGERNAAKVTDRMRELLEAANARIDYAVLADPETLAEVGQVDGPAVALVAAWIGKTRLIDNRELLVHDRSSPTSD
jgi:pantoate--beta-alanine ligase